ncbi:MAG: ribosome biogenesis GTPase YlqF, partial [Eubacteriales bacterium]
MPSDQIQWFPGHMAKTRRLMTECMPLCDIVIEILDSRIPRSSQNPEVRRLCAGKPMLTLLSKTSLSDPEVSARWKKFFTERTEDG